MSGNAIAVQQQQSILPTVDTWNQILTMGTAAYKSGLIPTSIKSPEAAAIIMMRGYELGLPPMLALDSLFVVNNKIGCSADLMLARIRQEIPGVEIEIVESTDKICKINAKRPGEKKFTLTTYTIEEAGVAKLLGKDNWQKHPADMLFARCVSRMKRRQFNEVLKGLSHVPEELEDIRDVTPQSPLPEKPAETTAAPQSIKTVKNHAPGGEDRTVQKDPAPASADKQPNAEKTSMTNTSPTARGIVSADIQELATKLGYDAKKLGELILDWKKKTVKECTTDELMQVRDSLEAELDMARRAAFRE